MTMTIGTRWQVTFTVQQVVRPTNPLLISVWHSWFALPTAEEVAARHALHETLTQERATWTRTYAFHCGGMTQ